MSKDSKKDLNLLETGRALKKRLRLSRQYHGGELDYLRKFRSSIGGVNWRILRYQRVIDPEKAFLPLSQFSFVTPKTFEKHLKQLRRECRIVPLSELFEALEKKEEIPEKTVAITLDGGWMDSFLYAFPIIKEQQVPVTMFLPTAFINTYDMFWPDKALLAFLVMKEAGMTIEPFEFFSDSLKEAMKISSSTGQITLQTIFLMLAGLEEGTPAQRTLALGFLGEIFNSLRGELPVDPFFARWDELRIMEQFGVTFGSLGHTHCMVSELTRPQIDIDLDYSLECMTEHLKEPLRVFAPPMGVVSREYLSALEERELFRCVLLDQGFEESESTAGVICLRRVPMYEAIGSTTELFYCALWDIPIGSDS